MKSHPNEKFVKNGQSFSMLPDMKFKRFIFENTGIHLTKAIKRTINGIVIEITFWIKENYFEILFVSLECELLCYLFTNNLILWIFSRVSRLQAWNLKNDIQTEECSTNLLYSNSVTWMIDWCLAVSQSQDHTVRSECENFLHLNFVCRDLKFLVPGVFG